MDKNKPFAIGLIQSILLLFICTSIIVSTLSNLVWLRVIFGLPLVFIIPGLLLIGILWPENDGIDPLWRASLIIPTSIALVGLILLGLNYFWVYRFEYALSMLTILNILLLATHFIRTNKRECYLDAISINLKQKNIEGKKRTSLESLLLIGAILFFIGSVSYSIITPNQTEPLTEFYVLNADRSLPLSVKHSQQPTDLIVGVFNHEGKDIKYTLEIQAVHENRSENLFFAEYYVQNGELIEPLISFPPIPNYASELRLLLFKDDLYDSYRDLKILVE